MSSRDVDTPFLGLQPGDEQRLDATRNFAAAGHLWSGNEIHALIFAYAARRPLLVRGEAGSGKSQIARAAAHVLAKAQGASELPPAMFMEVIHPRFEALDLLYRFDQVERLADAHANDLDRSNVKYMKHGTLWQAIEHMNRTRTTPVLLIDEIDKADAEVPNALLEVLGNRSFKVPHLHDVTIQSWDGRLPLIIITTNEERELPPAFVRRCAVLNLDPPEGEIELKKWLVRRASAHAHLGIVRDHPAAQEQRGFLYEVADQVWKDRSAAIEAGFPKVGLAEYIDLLTALDDLTRGTEDRALRVAKQQSWLGKLSAYALVKNAGQRQDRRGVREAE